MNSKWNSRKFWLTVLGSTLATVLAGMGFPPEIIKWIIGLIGAGIASQGAVDLGAAIKAGRRVDRATD